MRLHLRSFVPVLLLAGAVACDSCSVFEGNVESHVDVPITLGALEAWAEERGLAADIGLVERTSSGGMACGHSPACVILLPVIVVDAVMPPTTKRGSVTDDDGAVLYSGLFDLRGRLLRARVRAEADDDTGDDPAADEAVYRTIARLDLDELGEHPIVELSRTRYDAEGNELETTETPLLEQVDLVAMYAEALADESDGDDRADLVVEELTALGEPGLAAVEERYRELGEIDDEELAGVLHEVCAGSAPGAEAIVRVAGEKGGLASAVEAVPCVANTRADEESSLAIANRVVDGACHRETDRDALPAAIVLARHMPEAVDAGADRCEDVVRRLHLRFHGGERPSDAELVRVLREDRRASLLVDAMSAREAEDRRVLIEALDAERVRVPIARALNAGTTEPPSDDEAERVMAVFATDGDGSDISTVRHQLLAWVNRGAAPERVVRPLRRHGRRPHHAAALLLLRRERQRFGDALVGLETDQVRWGRFDSHFGSLNKHTVVAYALVEAGCSRNEIIRAARAARGGGAGGSCEAWSVE